MSNELHWGGINSKSLCRAIAIDIWMVFAVIVIAYLGLGIADSVLNTPSYTASTVVAVYPFNKMYTPEASSGALETVSSVNSVFNSDMFRTGLEERLKESVDFSLTSQQIRGTYILMLSVSSPSPENAYKILQFALDYYREISAHLVGDSYLEILTGPDFPSSITNDSKILKYRPLLSLLMGFAMGCFLLLMYMMRKTYKTASAIRKSYRNVRFFRITASASKKNKSRNKRKSVIVPNPETIRKTAIELIQILRDKKAKSVYITSAASGEGKTEITVSLSRELAVSGKSVLILETDPENSEIQDYVDFERMSAGLPDQSIKVMYADKNKMQDDYSSMLKEVEKVLEQSEVLADIILVDGRTWTGSRDDLIWKETADTSLAVCRQDKADFYAIDRMMTDLRKNNSELLGCVLYGF